MVHLEITKHDGPNRSTVFKLDAPQDHLAFSALVEDKGRLVVYTGGEPIVIDPPYRISIQVMDNKARD